MLVDRSKYKSRYIDEQQRTTNADRIRAMSDEELAEFLNRVKEPCDCCQLAVVAGACTETLCDEAMMKWLKQPAETPVAYKTSATTADRCVCCGAIIPEGQMVCPNCLVTVKEG